MKTPILRPAVEAVAFGFERIGMVVRIAWLPIALTLALYATIFGLLAGPAIANLGAFDGDFERLAEALFASPGFFAGYALANVSMPFAAMLILSCVYVAITRAATLADYEPPALPFYFALGGRELRYFLTRILYALLIIAATAVIAGLLAVAVFAAAAGAQAAADASGKTLIIAAAAAVGAALVLLWLWVVLRFLPVLAIAAVENRIAFSDAWKMTKGNFWRLLLSGAIFLAVFEGVAFVLILAALLSALPLVGLSLVAGALIGAPAAIAGFAVVGVFVLVAAIGLGAFALAAQAAYPARLYAYLTGCGDACRI